MHPAAGTVRPDLCGAIVLGIERVSNIDETRMRFVNTTYYCDTFGRLSGAVPLGLFGRKRVD